MLYPKCSTEDTITLAYSRPSTVANETVIDTT